MLPRFLKYRAAFFQHLETNPPSPYKLHHAQKRPQPCERVQMSRRPPFHQLGVALANGKLPAAGQGSTDDLLPSTWPGGPNNSKLPAGSGARHRRLSARHNQNGGPLQHAERRMPPLAARRTLAIGFSIADGCRHREITRNPRRRLCQGLRHNEIPQKTTSKHHKSWPKAETQPRPSPRRPHTKTNSRHHKI